MWNVNLFIYFWVLRWCKQKRKFYHKKSSLFSSLSSDLHPNDAASLHIPLRKKSFGAIRIPIWDIHICLSAFNLSLFCYVVISVCLCLILLFSIPSLFFLPPQITLCFPSFSPKSPNLLHRRSLCTFFLHFWLLHRCLIYLLLSQSTAMSYKIFYVRPPSKATLPKHESMLSHGHESTYMPMLSHGHESMREHRHVL